jgi:hypothetical protein
MDHHNLHMYHTYFPFALHVFLEEQRNHDKHAETYKQCMREQISRSFNLHLPQVKYLACMHTYYDTRYRKLEKCYDPKQIERRTLLVLLA